MTWLWRIAFSWALLSPLAASTVSGRIELADSREASVRKKMDYSGVVVSLHPVNTPVAFRAPRRARMIQKDKTFTPHVLAVQVGATVEFPNLDPIFHNAFSNYNGELFDVGLYPPGSSRSVHFTRPGVVRVFCNIHSAMSAVIVVLDSPYFATTNRAGEYEIKDVPPGPYLLTVFHERATPAALQAVEQRVTVGDQPIALAPIRISESGYLTIPHKNKYGRDYPPVADDNTVYPVRK
jgi:plastocyanin